MDGRSRRRRRRLVSAFGPFMKLNVGIIAPPLDPPPPPQGIKNELAAGGGGRRGAEGEEKAAQCRREGWWKKNIGKEEGRGQSGCEMKTQTRRRFIPPITQRLLRRTLKLSRQNTTLKLDA